MTDRVAIELLAERLHSSYCATGMFQWSALDWRSSTKACRNVWRHKAKALLEEEMGEYPPDVEGSLDFYNVHQDTYHTCSGNTLSVEEFQQTVWGRSK